MSEYSEKFKDPRWQKLRLELLNEANWTCENCGAESRSLHVHHKFYTNGSEPWEYDTIDFKILCDRCHKELHDTIDVCKRRLGELGSDEVMRVSGYITGVLGIAPFIEIENKNEVLGWCDASRTTKHAYDYADRCYKKFNDTRPFIALLEQKDVSHE